MGRPSVVIGLITDRLKRRSFRSKRKGSSRRRRISRESTTLTAWAATVAIAAPAVPMWNTATSRRSPAMLQTQAISTVIKGVLESPIPRKMLPIRLYAMMNTEPRPQMRI